jgi:two-component system, chemotaxis family, protein-glutamate methylesterase/glutaminase
MHTRDVIVIGSSMGGIRALSTLVAALPRDLPAAVFVVQHIGEDSRALLSSILAHRGPLPAVTAEDGMKWRAGQIHVAPPGRHMLISDGRVRVGLGPRENRSRPAIDPLFRTAAAHYSSRVIGVILTGLLNDGASGLLAVASCGGTAIVQDPGEAEFPDMPCSALAAVPAAQRASLADLPLLLSRLASDPAPPPPDIPAALRLEVRLTESAMTSTENWHELPGTPTNFTCPECSGAIQEVHADGVRRYRCRVGHAYSAGDLLMDKARAVEDSLWVALQTLQERAEMLDRLAQGTDGSASSSAAPYTARAQETRRHAQRLRELLAELPE